MNENRPGYSLKAPGSSEPGSPLRLPGRAGWPDLDDHLVVPEMTRDEIVGGRKVVTMPALPPHADQQTLLDHVVESNVAPGYQAASDLLTRHDVNSDFASDTCVRKIGVDPRTGGRHLEEIVFEIVAEQNERDVTEKAELMHARGVRRIFAIFLKKPRVAEWSAGSRSWRTLDPGSPLADPCLVKPIAVAALLDAAAAKRAAFEGMVAQGGPAVQELKTAVRSEGKAEGKAEDVIKVLETRGLTVSPDERQQILSCRDLGRLDGWLVRAVVALSTAAVLSEG